MRAPLIATALACAAMAAPAHAVIITTFGQTSGSNTLTGTANAGDTATSLSAQDVAVDVTQCVVAIGCLGSEFLDITASSTDQAQLVGTAVTQHFSGSFTITSLAGGLGVNILSGVFTDAVFGSGPSLTLAVGNPPDSLVLTSDVIPASELAAPNGISFGFTNVLPPTQAVGSGCAQFPNSVQPCTLGSFTAGIAGNVSASVVETPEPASLAVLGVGLFGLAFVARRRYGM